MSNSGFSAIIACLQEIEIAIDDLIISDSSLESLGFSDLKVEIRGFFSNPSADNAKQILDILRKLEQPTSEGSLLTQKFSTPLVVDGVKTTLSGLCEEFSEVIEDLS